LDGQPPKDLSSPWGTAVAAVSRDIRNQRGRSLHQQEIPLSYRIDRPDAKAPTIDDAT
jgi:hypothetical protein